MDKTFTRRSDNKQFTLKLSAHWCDIEASDGEVDSVKWYGNEGDYELFVSADKGHSYRRSLKVKP